MSATSLTIRQPWFPGIKQLIRYGFNAPAKMMDQVIGAVGQVLPPFSQSQLSHSQDIADFGSPPYAYYIATDGNDSNDGSLGSPVATPEQVSTLIAAYLTANPGFTSLIYVYFRGGTYSRTTTWNMTTSGFSASENVVWLHYPGEVALISGGQVLNTANWSLLASGDAEGIYARLLPASQGNVYVIDLNTDEGITDYGSLTARSHQGYVATSQATKNAFGTLYANGVRQDLACWPKRAAINGEQTWAFATTKFTGGTVSGTFTADETITQSGSGAAFQFKYVDSGNVYAVLISGTPTSTGTLTGDTSSATYTPTGRTKTSATNLFTADDRHTTKSWTLNDTYNPVFVHEYSVNWSDGYNQITGSSGTALTMSGVSSYSGITEGEVRYQAINVLEELSEGETWLDTSTGKLYWYPPTGVDPTSDETVFVTLDSELLTVSSQNYVKFDLDFKYTRDHGALVTGGSYIDFDGSTVKHTGKSGVYFNSTGTTATHHTFQNGSVEDTGEIGISLGGCDTRTLVDSGNTVYNVEVSYVGQWCQCYMPGINFGGYDNFSIYDACGGSVSYIYIHHTPAMAIWFTGCMHTVEYFKIDSACLHSGDMGAVYQYRSQWNRGNSLTWGILKNTYFRHKAVGGRWATGDATLACVGLYHDECGGWDIYGVVVDNCDIGLHDKGMKHHRQQYVIIVNCEWSFDHNQYATYNKTGVTLSSGTPTSGHAYRIMNNSGGADFTGIGAADNNVGTWFIANGSAPTWGTGSIKSNGTEEFVTYMVPDLGPSGINIATRSQWAANADSWEGSNWQDDATPYDTSTEVQQLEPGYSAEGVSTNNLAYNTGSTRSWYNYGAVWTKSGETKDTDDPAFTDSANDDYRVPTASGPIHTIFAFDSTWNANIVLAGLAA